jgi:hypothetical protein
LGLVLAVVAGQSGPVLGAPKGKDGEQARFWKMVDDARSGTRSDTAFMGRLGTRLRGLKVEEIVEFDRQFYEVHRGSYRWDLWGACYLMMGGCSDDGFEYFRAWLIGQGQTVFERSLRDPDSLAALPRGGELEDLMHLCATVYKEKTGKRIPWPPPQAAPAPTTPLGVQWDFENKAENKKRLPKLAAKFD